MSITLEKIYTDFRAKEKLAKKLLEQMNWFGSITDFDPKTGAALPKSLSGFLAKVAQPEASEITRDRLWRITEHCRASVERLFHSLNESPRREHALLPVHAVRELDANSFIKLSNRPGRTIREKLAGNPYIQAVRRFQSVDLPENRLLKAFAIRLAEMLDLRGDCLGQEDELLSKIYLWLRSDEAQAIGNWENLPPNNTLLAHRDYRHVWDAWRWLQTLDEDITSDLSQLDAREKTMRLWQQCAQMWLDGKHLFAEIPLLFDYEKFEILPWTSKPPLFKEVKYKMPRHLRQSASAEPICVDITALHPRYAIGDGKGAQSLAAPFLWQRWQRENETVDIELFGSDAVWLNPDATTISAPDLFFAKDNATELFDPAARAFTTRLREEFKNDTLIWLAPDFLNDFELEVIRRNLNARFPNAEPLPRSVAAVFAQADPAKITGEGYAIIVVDSIGGKTTATKLIAKRDKNLAKRLPITKGFYWERCPPVVIPGEEAERLGGSGYDIITLDANGRWHDAIRPAKPPFIEAAHLKRIPNIGNFAFCINLMESPVMGGIHLHALQQQVADIPLWRDQIPELSVKVMKDGHQQRFHLVLRGTTVKPIRGKPVTIPVDEFFTLPAGRPHYSFPLYVGDKGDDFGFSARLDSPAFPLENKVDCELNLTFEYGADDPYKLVFTPRDKSFPPIRATWRRTEEITDAPAPEYPQPMTWAELQRFPKQDSNKTSDLLDWVERAIEQLDRDFYIRPKQRTTGTVNRKWLTDKIGGQFTFATCKSTDESVFIHQNSFVHELSYADFTEGAEISFELQERDGKFSGWKVAGPRYKDEVRLKNFDEESAKNLVASIRKRLYFPVIQVWRDGRSTGDRECPKGFADAMKARGEHLVALLNESGIPEQVKNEIRFLMACMHKDAPENCVQWITGQVEGQKIRDLRAVGFALGDVSQQWQKDLLSQLVANPSNDALSILAYAIWREQQFVEKFSLANLQSILNALNIMLNIKQYPPRKDEWTARNWIRATTEPLELLLGLLRTRASSTPEIKILLQPHQKITKELAKKIERVTEIVTLSNIKLFSRVKINIQKPSGDRTPDLLYALRLYLTGDDGANAIHISSVSDGNTDETI
ncbi:cold shock domain-containing protein [Pseudomonas aeruginosa]|uniref:cold shock domain-containing protein n=1 Tax=Pseudomonas aeruginosa TaxID=287 RepID=UPI000F53BDD7|nr:cold shock domain-containing protein [Pseudomonas aeruginosa]RQI71546.1 DNA-binding protein [Pseudomonas aeruginosa]